MKKVYLLFGLLLSLLFINVVYADGPFYLDFNKPAENDGYPFITRPYKDGYLFVDQALNREIVISKRDINGNLIKKNTLPRADIVEVSIIDDHIYLIVGSEEEFLLMLIDDNMEVAKTSPLGTHKYSFFDGMSHYVEKMDDQLYVSGFTDLENGNENTWLIRKYKDDLSSYDEITFSEFIDFKEEYWSNKGFNNAAFDNIYNNHHLIQMRSDATEQNVAALGKKQCDNGQNDCVNIFISLLKPNGKVVWTKTIEGYEYTGDVLITNDYVLAVVGKDTSNSYVNDILVYDIEGNLVQTIKVDENTNNYEEFVYNLVKTDQGFVANYTLCQGKAPGCKANQHIGYYLYRHIEPKVTTGKGKIEVTDKQKPGEPVEFVVTPDEGYVLGSVKVTDADGNVVVFTSNRFTMPNANVTIEVEFLVANAETVDIAIWLLIALALLTATVTIVQYRKLRRLY